MSLPIVTVVAPGSPAESAGLAAGDEVLRLNGLVPRDIIEWRFLADEAEVDLEVRRGNVELHLEIVKADGEPLGVEVESAVFDRVRTCDNHCEFCFIYQLPKGLRKSLYLKDDDYRLSFLYGNFTTLTRFTEADLERVITERLSPLHVSIHATDPEIRSRILKNPRGGMSLRWLGALLDNGITVHGQIVVCPGVNDGAVLDDTLAGVLDQYPELASIACVPLGLSRFNKEPAMRAHTLEEAEAVLDTIDAWQDTFLAAVGHRMVLAADEYYLMAGRPFPPAADYAGFDMHEDGIGMARTFTMEFTGEVDTPVGPQSGFFAWVDGAPATGYRAPRNPAGDTGLRGCNGPLAVVGSAGGHVLFRPSASASTAILTGEFGAKVLRPLIAATGRDDVRVLAVRNEFFGGNTAVTGLMVGEDVARVLNGEPMNHRYLLPDVCLSEGRFLDGMTVDDLPRAVEVVATNGISLREALAVTPRNHVRALAFSSTAAQ
ncbi:MAG: DUF512 domain-containing protein [Ilumatobacteraceae bacterium]